jgi:hypothetical protein
VLKKVGLIIYLDKQEYLRAYFLIMIFKIGLSNLINHILWLPVEFTLDKLQLLMLFKDLLRD